MNKVCKACNQEKPISEFGKVKGKNTHRAICKDCTPKKYNNKKKVFNGITFDSEMEAEYYQHLIIAYRREDIKLQPVFLLQPSFKKFGKTHRAIEYKGDFQIENVVYDVKGFETADFKIKRKMFEYRYPALQLVLVKKEKGKFVQI